MSIFKQKLDTYQDYEKRDNKLKSFTNFLQNCFKGVYDKQLKDMGYICMDVDGWAVKVMKTDSVEKLKEYKCKQK